MRVQEAVEPAPSVARTCSTRVSIAKGFSTTGAPDFHTPLYRRACCEYSDKKRTLTEGRARDIGATTS